MALFFSDILLENVYTKRVTLSAVLHKIITKIKTKKNL